MAGLTNRAYLAGPDIHHPQAAEIARNKHAICEKYGIVGISPLIAAPSDAPNDPRSRAMARFHANLDTIRACQVLIANMTPFRGPSMDGGTVLEMGFMLGLGRPVVGYSLDNQSYTERLERLHMVFEEPLNRRDDLLQAPDGLRVEDYGLGDTFMVACAALSGPAPIAHDFEESVRWARRLIDKP
jgi:nucleoside 2-deoxyribosyltransferase